MKLVKCAKCTELKTKDNFAKCSAKKNGLHSYCRPCASEYRMAKPKYKYTDIEKERAVQFRHRYGLERKQFEEMWSNQNACCAICEGSLTRDLRGYAIDHNHDTKEVRGILCNTCNTSLGGFKDSPEILRKAANYLIEKGHYGPEAT